MRAPLSAVLITHNAADQLEPCLLSLAFTDEIVVLDSGSSDDTEAIARRFGARWLEHAWQGFGAQKRHAVSLATHDWVLCIDADERVTDDLARAIEGVLQAPQAMAFETTRSNFFMGRYLCHGEGFPDWSLRLFNRRFAQWSDDTVHEKVVTTGKVARLQSRRGLLHHSADDLFVYLEKQNRYTTLQAQALFAAGAKPGCMALLLSPLMRFIKFYLWRLGFLDGVPGLIHIAIGCFNSFAKYAKLFALQRKQT